MTEEKKQDKLNNRLYQACRWNNIPETRRLLDAGADPNAYVDPESIIPSMTLPEGTPLFAACWHSYYDIARLLLEKGADVNKGLRGGCTNLHMCAIEGRTHTTQFLLDHGADVNVRDRNKDTPLHAACVRGYVDTVKILLEHGASTAISNKHGKTVVHYVSGMKTNREEIIDLFRQYAPETTLESVLKLPPEDPLREKTLEWYREHHPEMVMEAYCNPGPGGT